MPIISAPGDTWGISGPDFLRVYLGALAAFLIVAIAIRLSVTRASASGPSRMPTASEVAVLVGGRTQAVYASVAALRAVGALGNGARGKLTATGPLPSGATPIDAAVHDAAGRGIKVTQLSTDLRVQAAFTELETRIAGTGWLLDPGARTRARLGGVLLLGLAGFGAVRIGIANDRAVRYLLALDIVTLLLALRFLAVPRVSRAGRPALAETRARNGH